jgi:cyanosortase A-associated protein
MRLFRRIKRSMNDWVRGLVYTPSWSVGHSRLGAWVSRLFMGVARARMPFADGQNQSRWASLQEAIARPLQIGMLSLVTVAAVVGLASIWIAPGWGAYRPAPITYPEPSSVPGWESAGWERLEIAPRDRPRALSGAVYTYRAGTTLLEAEVRFLDRANGDVASYWQRRTGLDLEGQLRSLPGGGSYRVHTSEGTVWLDACVDASGHSVATSQQFDTNRKLYDRSLRRLGWWLLARQPLEDRRCLWVHLSIPADSVSDEAEGSRLLESFWAQWHGVWRGRLGSASSSDVGPG